MTAVTSPGVWLVAFMFLAACMFPEDASRAVAFASITIRLEILNIRYYIAQRRAYWGIKRMCETSGLPVPEFKFVRIQDRRD